MYLGHLERRITSVTSKLGWGGWLTKSKEAHSVISFVIMANEPELGNHSLGSFVQC